MFAILEMDHGDFGSIYDTREEALAGLAEIRQRVPQAEAESFGVVELDEQGFPVKQVQTSNAVAAR